jgi:hypothetical protein
MGSAKIPAADSFPSGILTEKYLYLQVAILIFFISEFMLSFLPAREFVYILSLPECSGPTLKNHL